MTEHITITVLLVDDHEVVRTGLRSMLVASDIDVIGEASNGKEALQKIADLKPVVVLMDIRMSDMDGITALERLEHAEYRPRVIMITTYKSSNYLLRSLAAGATGYILKDISRNDLLDIIRSVAVGERHIDQTFLQSVLRELADESSNNTDEITGLPTPLSSRESEVLQLVVEGMTNQSIAYSLGVSSHTIKEHVQNIYRKLDATNRTEAAVKAIRMGLVK